MSTFHDHSYSQTTPINRLPAEILTIIFILAGPPTYAEPRVYLLLTWVCRYWRTVVIGNPAFWTVVCHSGRRLGSLNLMREFIHRSKSFNLDILWCLRDVSPAPGSPSISCLSLFDSSHCSRIRTLNLQTGSNEFLSYCGKHWIECSFPQLENLILPSDADDYYHFETDDELQAFKTFLEAPRLQYVEISASYFDGQMSRLARSLSNVNRLKIVSYEAESQLALSINLIYLILSDMPNLRILNLVFRCYAFHNSPIVFPQTITLPNLRMLSMDASRKEYHAIQTVSLEYLGLCAYKNFKFEDSTWRHLDSIDWSTIRNVRVDFEERPKKPYYNDTVAVGCISTGRSEADCRLFQDFHEPVGLRKVSPSDILPKKGFHIELPWTMPRLNELCSRLIHATNLVELILDFRVGPTNRAEDLGFHCFNRALHGSNFVGKDAFLVDLLSTLNTVNHLTVLRSPSFRSICALLVETESLPHLERLTYHSLIPMKYETFLPIETLQYTRASASFKPLKVLELKDRVIPSETVAEIEALGIEVIQLS